MKARMKHLAHKSKPWGREQENECIKVCVRSSHDKIDILKNRVSGTELVYYLFRE